MQVTTPIADMRVTIDRLVVEDGVLVLTNAETDAMPTRAVIGPSDMRRIIAALLKPRVIWFAITCLFRPGDTGQSGAAGPAQNHPTPNPW